MRSRNRGRKPSHVEVSPEELELLEESGLAAPLEPPVDRKTAQVCKRVERTLACVLAGEVADEALAALAVESVSPDPGVARLRVVLLATAKDAPEEAELRRRLAAIHGFLRAQVAAAVNRKKAPELVFEVVRLGGAS